MSCHVRAVRYVHGTVIAVVVSMSPKLAPLVAIPALALAVVSVILPALLGAAVVACLVAHVVASFRASSDAETLASWADCDSLDLALADWSWSRDVDAAIDAATSERFYRLQAARLPRATVRPSVRPFTPYVAPSHPSRDVQSSARREYMLNLSTNVAQSTVQPTIPAPSVVDSPRIAGLAGAMSRAMSSESIAALCAEVASVVDCGSPDAPSAAPIIVSTDTPSHAARVAWDALQSCRDACIRVRVACTVRDRATASRWLDIAIGLSASCSDVASRTLDRHACGWSRDAVTSVRDAARRFDAAFATSSVASLARVTRDVAPSPSVLTVSVTRILPMLSAAPTFRALPLKASRAKRASRARASA